jgi:hypothetical protein
VPEGSTIDRELKAYEMQWNKMLDKTARENLTEDVNLLIRDYLRKIIRTLKGSNFDLARVQNLAETLVKLPGMQKITDHGQLYMYVQLYIVRLLIRSK